MKTLILAIAFATAVSAAHASYLYWQVDPAAGDNTASSFSDYNAARVGYYSTAGANGQILADVNGDASQLGAKFSDAMAVSDGAMGARAELDVSAVGADGYTYFIELVNWDGKQYNHVAFGEELTYSDLASKGYVSTDLPGGQQVPATWHGGTYNAVPEPTGALMMVLGLAFLGLKRRTA